MSDAVGFGTRVRYHGSLTEYTGRDFVVIRTSAPLPGSDVSQYAGGVAYELRELGGGASLYNVRRTSFTVSDQ